MLRHYRPPTLKEDLNKSRFKEINQFYPGNLSMLDLAMLADVYGSVNIDDTYASFELVLFYGRHTEINPSLHLPVDFHEYGSTFTINWYHYYCYNLRLDRAFRDRFKPQFLYKTLLSLETLTMITPDTELSKYQYNIGGGGFELRLPYYSGRTRVERGRQVNFPLRFVRKPLRVADVLYTLTLPGLYESKSKEFSEMSSAFRLVDDYDGDTIIIRPHLDLTMSLNTAGLD